jgi:hypothetical protein
LIGGIATSGPFDVCCVGLDGMGESAAEPVMRPACAVGGVVDVASGLVGAAGNETGA